MLSQINLVALYFSPPPAHADRPALPQFQIDCGLAARLCGRTILGYIDQNTGSIGGWSAVADTHGHHHSWGVQWWKQSYAHAELAQMRLIITPEVRARTSQHSSPSDPRPKQLEWMISDWIAISLRSNVFKVYSLHAPARR